MAKDLSTFESEQALVRERRVAMALQMGTTLLGLLIVLAVVGTRGRLVMNPFFAFIAIGGFFGLYFAFSNLSAEVRGLSREISRRRGLAAGAKAVEPPLAPEELKLASIKKTVASLPEKADPEHIALLRLTEETGEDLVALIVSHRERGTVESLEAKAALRELDRLDRESKLGLQNAAATAPLADALERAAQISFRDRPTDPA